MNMTDIIDFLLMFCLALLGYGSSFYVFNKIGEVINSKKTLTSSEDVLKLIKYNANFSKDLLLYEKTMQDNFIPVYIIETLPLDKETILTNFKHELEKIERELKFGDNINIIIVNGNKPNIH